MEIKATSIVMVPINKIIPNDKNNNIHTEEQKRYARKIFDYQGFRAPLLISNRTGKLVAGHLRLEIAKEKNVKELPCMFQDFDSEEQEYAHLTADNALAAQSSLDFGQINSDILEFGPFDIELLGIKDFVIEPIEKLEPQCDEDEVLEVVHPITRKGDIWILGNHRLMCGDSTMIDDVEKLMNGEKADMVFTDPPYGMGYKSNGWDSNKKSPSGTKNDKIILGDETTKAGIDAIRLCSGFIKKDVHLFFWCRWDSFDDFRKAAEEFCDIKGNIVWDKGDAPGLGDLECSFGGNEMAVHAIIGRRKLKKRINSVWKANRPKGLSMVHPTQKPIEIIEPAIENCTNQNEIILDLFLGSGSTLIAAEKNNRKCYGNELDEKYCDVIIKRWEQYTGKKATLELTGQTYEELKVERDN